MRYLKCKQSFTGRWLVFRLVKIYHRPRDCEFSRAFCVSTHICIHHEENAAMRHLSANTRSISTSRWNIKIPIPCVVGDYLLVYCYQVSWSSVEKWRSLKAFSDFSMWRHNFSWLPNQNSDFVSRWAMPFNRYEVSWSSVANWQSLRLFSKFLSDVIILVTGWKSKFRLRQWMGNSFYTLKFRQVPLRNGGALALSDT